MKMVQCDIEVLAVLATHFKVLVVDNREQL